MLIKKRNVINDSKKKQQQQKVEDDNEKEEDNNNINMKTVVVKKAAVVKKTTTFIRFLLVLCVLSATTILRFRKISSSRRIGKEEVPTTLSSSSSLSSISDEEKPFFVTPPSTTTTDSDFIRRYPFDDVHVLKYYDDSSSSTTTQFSDKEMEENYQIYEGFRDELLSSMDEDNTTISRKYYHDEESEAYVPFGGCYRPNWKSKSYVNCNIFHEIAMKTDLTQNNKIKYRGSGYFRDAWTILLFSDNDDDTKINATHDGSKNNNNKNDHHHDNIRDTPPAEEQQQQQEEGFGVVVVLKTQREIHPITIKEMTQVSKEAIIMERLTGSPYIVNIYGYCGVSTLVENMPFEVQDEINNVQQLPRDEIQQIYNTYNNNDNDHNQNNDEQPPPPPSSSLPFFNNLTSIERLNMTIDVAKSLATIHGYKGGVIVHGDSHPVQWLRNSYGQLKLNDFNVALILDWNFQMKQYCTSSRKIPGTFRSPEQHTGSKTVDEKSEMFAMGGMIYTIIFGIYPYWEFDNINERHEYVRTGSLLPPPIFGIKDWYSKSSKSKQRLRKDYPIEYALLQIMENCYIYYQKARPDIFQVLSWLQEIQP